MAKPTDGGLKIKLKMSGSRITAASGLTASGNLIRPPEFSSGQHGSFPAPLESVPPKTTRSSAGATLSSSTRAQSASAALPARKKRVRQASRPSTPTPPPPLPKTPSSAVKIKQESLPPTPDPQSFVESVDTAAEPETTKSAPKARAARAKRQNVKRKSATDLEGSDFDLDYNKDSSNFWKGIEECRAPFTDEDLAFCDPEKVELSASSEILQVPELGPSYRDLWYQEDERELRDMNMQSMDYLGASTRSASRQHSRLASAVAGGGKPGEEVEDTVRCGELTSRLLSALIQDSVVSTSFFTKSVMDSDFLSEADVELSGGGGSALPPFLIQKKTLETIEKRLTRDLAALGLYSGTIKKPIRQEPPDEIEIQLRTTQSQLVELLRENAEKRKIFASRMLAIMPQQKEHESKKRTTFLQEEINMKKYIEFRKRKRTTDVKSEPPAKRTRTSSKGPPVGFSSSSNIPPPDESGQVDIKVEGDDALDGPLDEDGLNNDPIDQVDEADDAMDLDTAGNVAPGGNDMDIDSQNGVTADDVDKTAMNDRNSDDEVLADW